MKPREAMLQVLTLVNSTAPPPASLPRHLPLQLKPELGTPLVAQPLSLRTFRASTAVGAALIPGLGTKIPHVAGSGQT